MSTSSRSLKVLVRTVPAVSWLPVLILLVAADVGAESWSAIRGMPLPAGWRLAAGEPATGTVIRASGTRPLKLISDPLQLPVVCRIRFQAAEGGKLGVTVGEGAAPLLKTELAHTALNHMTVNVGMDGNPVPTDADTRSVIPAQQRGKPSGRLVYRWLFPKVGSLWDDDQRQEIGADYESLEPFASKEFVLRLVLEKDFREIWLDDRLVACRQVASPSNTMLSIDVAQQVSLHAVEFEREPGTDPFVPLRLEAYLRRKNSSPDSGTKLLQVPVDGRLVPVRLPGRTDTALDLGRSLYRFRNLVKSGMNAAYAGAMEGWAGAFEVDPARFAFRVPNRAYGAVWLTVSKRDQPHTVPRGVVRWFRLKAGFPADTEFELTGEAVRDGRAVRLSERGPGGEELFLLRVPVDSHGFAGLADLEGFGLDLELSKPVQPMRSYPDPIYYSSHPAGLPSSLTVHGVTLEEAPFSVSVSPEQFSYVFQQPEPVAMMLQVMNRTGGLLDAKIRIATTSHDLEETVEQAAVLRVPARGSESKRLVFDLRRYGWHALDVTVRAGGHEETRTLSLVHLPRDTRTAGTALNETRFGVWGSLHAHLTPFNLYDASANEAYLTMLRKLGLRRVGYRPEATTLEQIRRHGFLPQGEVEQTWGVRLISRSVITEEALEQLRKLALKKAMPFAETGEPFPFYYGGEWQISKEFKYGQDPRYTGQGARDFTAEELEAIRRHLLVMETVGHTLREACPKAWMILQWGAPKATLAYLQKGFPRDLVDAYGMDAPMFELLPEMPLALGCLNDLWTFRREIERLGWPQYPIYWREGPFLPTQPGALTLGQQADHLVRYLLLGLAYGIEVFDGSIQPYDAASYYGAEHYGPGIFYRVPYANPKPAVAALATATAMLCGMDFVRGIPTGVPTTYCAALEGRGVQRYALWRVRGTGMVSVGVKGEEAVVTDAMGNSRTNRVESGRLTIGLSSSPLWVTGVELTGPFDFAAPSYPDPTAAVVRALEPFTPDAWSFSTAPAVEHETAHWAVYRMAETNLVAEFVLETDGYGAGVAVTLPVQPGDRPLAIRYGTLVARQPVNIPGKPCALGMWIRGNGGWGRIVYQVRDAKGELWTSTGTRNEWNADDLHGDSFICFEGWRYVRFPMPGHTDYDAFRELETTWWGSSGGDAVVDYPVRLERITVEARNEVPCLGVMTVVPDRTCILGRLVAEYADESMVGYASSGVPRLKPPAWKGPVENPIQALEARATGPGLLIRGFREPAQAADGRSMHLDFDTEPGAVYRVYVSRESDGRGADVIAQGVQPGQLVRGLRPGIEMFFFLAGTREDRQEFKPSPPYRLVTEDKFREK